MEQSLILFIEKKPKRPIPWILKSPKRYNQNSIIAELHRSKIISSDFDTEIRALKINIVIQITLYLLSGVL